MKEFFNQCMLFKSEDKIDKIIGLITWITLSLLLTQIIWNTQTIKSNN